MNPQEHGALLTAALERIGAASMPGGVLVYAWAQSGLSIMVTPALFDLHCGREDYDETMSGRSWTFHVDDDRVTVWTDGGGE